MTTGELRYSVRWNAGSGERVHEFEDIDGARDWARTQSGLTFPRVNPDGSRPPCVAEVWDNEVTPRSRIEMWMDGEQRELPQ